MEENLASHQKALGLCKDSCVQGCWPPPCLPKVQGTLEGSWRNKYLRGGHLAPCSNKLLCVSQYPKALHCKIIPFRCIMELGIPCTHTSVQQE